MYLWLSLPPMCLGKKWTTMPVVNFYLDFFLGLIFLLTGMKKGREAGEIAALPEVLS